VFTQRKYVYTTRTFKEMTKYDNFNKLTIIAVVNPQWINAPRPV